MILAILVAALVLLGIIYYVSMYMAKKKTLKDWETDRGMLLSLLAQNILLLIAIFVSILYKRWFYADTFLLALQIILFILTVGKLNKTGRLWPLPLACLITTLHIITYL